MIIKIVEPYSLNKKYDIRSLTPNLGPVVVATLLKEAGHEVEVISEYVTRFATEDLKNADLVGISITTYNATRGFEIARLVEGPVVFGGFHASLMPQECLAYGDYVIRGDGFPVVALADFLGDRRAGNLQEIPNLVYKEHGKITYNKRVSKVVNLIPDFDLVKDYYRLNLNRLLRLPLLVNASRGCHGKCAFCSIIEVYQDVMGKAVDLVIQDIQSQTENLHVLSRVLPRTLWITDDNFSSEIKWAKALLSALASLNPGYRFVIQASVNIAEDDELLRLMREAGIGIVYLGIESVDQGSLNNLNKRTTTEEIEAGIRKIRQHGMDVHGLFVFGDDEFRKGDGDRVAEFVKKHKLSGALIQPLTPFPGTGLFAKMKKEGRILHEDWQNYNGKVVYRPKHLSAESLQSEIYRCYRKIYSPMHVLKYIFFGRRGFKMQILGEAIFRYLEGLRSNRYVREKLSQFET